MEPEMTLKEQLADFSARLQAEDNDVEGLALSVVRSDGSIGQILGARRGSAAIILNGVLGVLKAALEEELMPQVLPPVAKGMAPMQTAEQPA